MRFGFSLSLILISTGAIIPRKYAFLFIIVIGLLGAACSLPASPARRAAIQADHEATQAAYVVLTEMARPSSTPTTPPTRPPTATIMLPSATATQAPTETPPPGASPVPPKFSVTAQPGLSFVTLTDLAGYVFQVDPAVWAKDPQTGSLVHQTISGCQITPVTGFDLPTPQRILYQDFGRYRWMIADFGAYARTGPFLGSGLDQHDLNPIELKGYNRSACRADQEQLLTDLLTRGQALGQVSARVFQAPTPRPNADGFSCPNTPPARIRVDDYLSVVTDGLWLRAEPKADGEKIRKFLRYAPYIIHVIGGPVCDKYVYWQVKVSEYGAGEMEGVTVVGWLAEGDPSETYIIPVK